MKSGTILGVTAIMGAMLAADAQAQRGERIRGGGAARVEAIRSMDGFRGAQMRDFQRVRMYSQPRFVGERRMVRARPVAYRTRGEFIRPARRVVRSDFARPVAFRRDRVIRDRRLSSIRFADRDRYVVRRGDWIDRRGDWRDGRRHFRRAAVVRNVYAPAYYYPRSYYAPTAYYPASYYTAPTYYTTVTTVPRYTYALAGSSTVLAVQTELARLGYYEGALDGLMGPMTRSAILRYERDAGLPRFSSINRPLLISLGLA